MIIKRRQNLIKQMWKWFFVKIKYGILLDNLAEYTAEIIACQYADDELNNAWYNARVATTGILFLHVHSRDGMRFLRCVDIEASSMAKMLVTGTLMKSAVDRWKEFEKFTFIWRKRYYPPIQRRAL